MASRGFIELLRLADLARARKTGRHESAQALWSGIVFDSLGERLVAPLGEISEVLAVPEHTTVPRTKPWLLGIANVRGRLLPLVDLALFLGDKAPSHRFAKVLVVDTPQIFIGIVVEQVHGIVQFLPQQYVGERLDKRAPLAPYNHGKFDKEEQSYTVFMPSLLIDNPQFLNAAI